MSRAAMIAALLLALVGCGGPAPTPAPGGFEEVISELVLRGATISRHVSGDPGCPDSRLHSNALRLDVRFGAEDRGRSVYLFRWRRPSDFDASAAEFQACVAEFERVNEGADVATVENAPWRAFGAGWSEQLRRSMDEALAEAGAG